MGPGSPPESAPSPAPPPALGPVPVLPAANHPAAASAPNPRAEQIVRRLLVGAALLATACAAVLLYLHRPQGQFFYPRCSFHTMTGWLCPGCGGMRSLHELLHGHLLAAARCNALFILGTPALTLAWILQHRRGRPFTLRPRTLWGLFALTLTFTLLRNLPIPAAAWLVP
jgi:hypothetical protein